MNAISASRGSYRETADGSLEVKIIIDPRFKEEFHKIFRTKDMPVAIAPLVADFERVEATKEDEPVNDIQKGGLLSQWLAIRCGEESFWRFVENQCGFNEGWIKSSLECDSEVKGWGEFESKKQIDNETDLTAWFHREIKLPYAQWVSGVR